MKKLLSFVALLCLSATAFADTAPQDLVLQCAGGTVGTSVAPWVSNCPSGGQSYVPPTDASIVVADSKTGTWQRFGDLVPARLLRVCLKGSTFTGASCTGNGTTSGAVFKAKSALTLADSTPPPPTGGNTLPPDPVIVAGDANTARMTWEAPTTNTDGTPLTDLAGFNIYQSGNATTLTAGTVPPLANRVGSTAKSVLSFTSTVLPVGVTQYFGVTAYNTVGLESKLSSVLSKTLTPAVLPTVSMSCVPADGVEKVTSSCTWSSSNATACVASGAWSGQKTLTGTESQPAVTASATYTLTCTGPGGSGAVSVPVIVSLRPGSVTGFKIQ